MKAAAYCFFVMLLLLGFEQSASATQYVVEVRSREDAQSVTCEDNKTVCHLNIGFVSENKEKMTVSVDLLVVPGEAYFSFKSGNEYLFTGGENYFSVPLGSPELTKVNKATAALYQARAAAKGEDPFDPVYRLPVLRGTNDLLTKLEITVKPLTE